MNVYAPQIHMLKPKFSTGCILMNGIIFLIVETPSHFLATSAIGVNNVKMSIYGPGNEPLFDTKSIGTSI